MSKLPYWYVMVYVGQTEHVWASYAFASNALKTQQHMEYEAGLPACIVRVEK